MINPPLAKQLDELQLIRCSLLPGELFTFIEDTKIWSELLEAHGMGTGLPDLVPASPAHIRIQIESARLSFGVMIPFQYAGNLADTSPLFTVKGDSLSRDEQERWQNVIKNKLRALDDPEYPIYQMISLHLLPLLHEELEELEANQGPADHPLELAPLPSMYHALLTSHHLISPNKRRSLQSWSASLLIAGFAKVGYPGVIYAQGQRENVEEFVANIKAMQWLALKVRFIEPLEGEPAVGAPEKRWNEFQKVGEVVEEMRRIGREQFIVEMGIGSAGTK